MKLASSEAWATWLWREGVVLVRVRSREPTLQLPELVVTGRDPAGSPRCAARTRRARFPRSQSYDAVARYSSRASSGTWAIPFTMTYRIFRSRTSRRRSFVGIPRRRAASDALNSSTAISTSGWLIEAKFTAQCGDLVFDLRQDSVVVTVG